MTLAMPVLICDRTSPSPVVSFRIRGIPSLVREITCCLAADLKAGSGKRRSPFPADQALTYQSFRFRFSSGMEPLHLASLGAGFKGLGHEEKSPHKPANHAFSRDFVRFVEVRVKFS
jgi:hypothetical protein